MTSKEIRDTFLNFFEGKSHKIVKSAPIVVKNDPTLMFTNAGMNQFKDFFLGNLKPDNPRIADTQKCLRVSGKHNDLEEVGVDTYHHTMFEMLGNWSFGNYFKEEAIAWAWELLTEIYQIPKDRLYVTVFEGDHADNVPEDADAYNIWKKYIAEDRILKASKKDNFWEMGDTGPCGPCSEIHVDIRSDADRALKDGKSLVNADHPQVVEIWNLVFIQFNRKADSTLEQLPDSHVDTGMGFERLCMVIQGKQSNYETDVFTPIIAKISEITGVPYGKSEPSDIALRVIADHIRAITFTIVDGQMPSNTGAGYVIRRILRRGVRYAFSFLDWKEPILYRLVEVLVEQFGELFPELKQQQGYVEKIILQEEKAFLRTLETGLQRFAKIEEELAQALSSTIKGEDAFRLLDTFGFPIDLTRLLATEKGLTVDEVGFKEEMDAQKERARQATKVETGDWTELMEGVENEFVGYDTLQTISQVVKYREVKEKKKSYFQIILDETPFYAESGGQVGDTGYLQFGDEKITVFDTKKENNLIVHFVKKLPEDITMPVQAVVSQDKRSKTANNHTAVHLIHAALHKVLGNHALQKGQLVNDEYLRFDFAHYEKVTKEETQQIERIVNEKIRQNIALEELRNIPIQEATDMGAMALFGEKYGDEVRVIIFDRDYSVELCGGTHVAATGEIGFCKIVEETSVAAGVRRLVGITGVKAFETISSQLDAFDTINAMFKKPKDLADVVQSLANENAQLKKEIERMQQIQANDIKNELMDKIEVINGVNFIGQRIDVDTADMVKHIAFNLRKEVSNLFLVLGANIDGKANLTIAFDDASTEENPNKNAGKIIRQLAKHIKGGGGGQAFYASAGGKDAGGIEAAIEEAKGMIEGF
ncbi:MAG: alanine--tRNA ligase [Chitinophagales bacterium]